MSNDIQTARFHETTVRLERIEGVQSEDTNNCGIWKIVQESNTGSAAKEVIRELRAKRIARERRSKRQR